MEENKEIQTIESPMEDKDKKIKNLISIVILLAGLFIGSVFVDVVQMTKGGGYSQKALNKTDVFESNGKTWVAFTDPLIKIQVLTDEKCEQCKPDDVLVSLRRVMPTISVSKVDSNSDEGKKIISDFSVKSLPAFIFSEELEKSSFFSQVQPLFEKKENKYVMNTAEAGIKAGKFIELPQISDSDIKIGPADAKVRITEFSDFQCPYCKKLHEDVISKMLKDYGDKVLFVYKHLPLAIHPQAENAALASECANEQGKFNNYMDKLFASQTEWGKTTGTQSFKNYAAQSGLNQAQFNSCLDSKKYQSKIDENKKEAGNFGITGTPSFFINDTFENGAVPYDDVKKIIDQELQK